LDVRVKAALGLVLSVRNGMAKLWFGLSYLAVSCHLFLLLGKTSQNQEKLIESFY
jgi:hypothetical protein